MTTDSLEFQINRSNIRDTRFVENETPGALAPNEVLLEIDHIAFTANNVTYAVAGDFLKYWNFFPTGDAAWGKLPVWGYADVSQSEHSDIAAGERVYGYFPLATHLVIAADRVKPSGFMDMVPHRQELNPIYNQYVRVQNVPGFEVGDSPLAEQLNALLRPMFVTSFLVDDFLRDSNLFDARVLILSSASSKTGYGTAFQLFRNRKNCSDYEIVGLTSTSNRAFVESLGCYDRVLAYDEMSTLDPSEAALYVDFSGSGELRTAVHTHFGDQLKYDCSIGLTDWEKQGASKNMSGVKPQLFFAPAQAQKRQQEWGASAFIQKVNAAMQSFVQFATDHIDVTVQSGTADAESTYLAMVNGELSPRKGFILSLG